MKKLLTLLVLVLLLTNSKGQFTQLWTDPYPMYNIISWTSWEDYDVAEYIVLRNGRPVNGQKTPGYLSSAYSSIDWLPGRDSRYQVVAIRYDGAMVFSESVSCRNNYADWIRRFL